MCIEALAIMEGQLVRSPSRGALTPTDDIATNHLILRFPNQSMYVIAEMASDSRPS